ncbi:hypothetical protein P3S67_002548 [Capsicum chacoense]
MKHLGVADVILGIRIHRTPQGLALSQSLYIKKVLDKFKYMEFDISKTTLDVSFELLKNEGERDSQLEYARVLGCLIFIINCTRPDIACAISKLSWYTSNPNKTHWMEMKRVLGYLKYTQDYVLHYNKYLAVLEGYSDANWITESNEVKSTSGYVFTISKGALAWKSSKQTCIARSTMESEFIALDKAGEEVKWLQNFLEYIPYWPKPGEPVWVHCDSQAEIVELSLLTKNFQLYLRKMVQNEIDDPLDQLGMIKSGGDQSSVEVDQIEKLELELRFVRTFIKYNHLLLPDYLIKITRTAQQVVKNLDFGRIPDECRTNINAERLVSQLQEFVEGNTSSMCNFELDDSDPMKYMDCLDKSLNDSLRLLSGGPDPDMTKEEKIFKKQLTYIQKRMRFLRYLYGTEINGCVGHEKLKGLRTQIQLMAENVGHFYLSLFWDEDYTHVSYCLCLIVLVELETKKIFRGELKFLLVFLGDVPNHKGKRLNEVLAKIGVVVGDILCVINEDAYKIDDAMIQILEKIEDLKADAEERYKSLKYSPSNEFPTVGGLSFLGSFLRKLNDMLKSESTSDFMMKPYIGTLHEDLSYLTSVFRDVAKVHHKDEEILKDLQRRTVKLAYEAEVSIDSILVQYNALSHYFCSLPAIIKESKQILAKVKVMSFQNLPLKPFSVVEPSKHGGPRENDYCQKVYNSGSIVHHFDVQAWCIISQSYNQRDLLQDIFSQVTGKEDKGDKEDILADELKKSLTGKRYLIVLDDMWNGKAWDDLRFSFPDVGNRSRIVITTRLEEVAKQVKNHIDPYSLPFLSPDESLKLLQKKVFQHESCPPSLQDVSKAVAERCKGLPLVIVLVAGIIKRNKMEASWWNEVKNSLVSYHGESEGYSLSTVQLSYDNLPDHLRLCHLYIGLFPEDARIPVSELINLWIAECFVQNIEESGRLEETAEGYLNDLISSNVVMVSGRRYNGKVKYCQVLDVVLHFCLNKSREEKLMLAVKGNPNRLQSSRWKDRRVSFNFTDELFSLGSKTFRQRMRSVIMTHEGDSCDWKSFFQLSDMRLVKVLYLNCPRDADIFSDIFRPLIHLKYLEVDSIFNNDWVLNLPHLETLIMRKRVHGESMKFWKMEKLRHVYIPEFIVDWKAPTSSEADYGKPFCINMESHTHLQSLSLFFPGSPVLGLQLPSNLKKLLVISYCDKLEEIPGSFADIPTLKQVELIGPCTYSLEASAVRIKEGVLENEGNDRIEIITKFMWVARKDR